MRVLVAVTGASGAGYAKGVLESLLEGGVERVGLIVSPSGAEVAAWEGVVLPGSEGGEHFPGAKRIERFEPDDLWASPASGSARWDAMVVVPCSMGTVGRLAAGVSGNLIERAADVMLKEGRRLILVPRETPLSLIHLRNLTTLAEAGAVILPAAPSFYSRPESVEAVCKTVTERILTRLGIDRPRYEWGKKD